MIRRNRFTLLGLALLACRPSPQSAPPAVERGERAAPAPAPAEKPSQLALVRAPGPPCGDARTPVGELRSRSEKAYDQGDYARARACAEAALEVEPRSVAALQDRATALVASGELEAARLAYATALAVDPDDPDTLYGAADLYVTRRSGQREELLLGREYALRGARIAQAPPRRDRVEAGELLLLAAMAENDLGESRRALEHAFQAQRLGANEADARYERGVALYELCRFAEARSALRRVVEIVPDDAWAHYYLGLVAERLGERGRAEALLRRARQLAPSEFVPPVEMDRKAFEQEVVRAVASLPEEERRALAHVPVEVADEPALEDLTAVDPPLSPTILGLFRGPSEHERCRAEDGPRCRSIVFYRLNLERFARSEAELREQVKVTLLHELGHLHGESDEQLRARGLE